MQILNKEDMEQVNILINEFIVSNQVNSRESIPVEFLKFLRENNFKIQDGDLLNEVCVLIEKKIDIQ
ncbi:MAG TPA: hypothetical protein VIK78_07335 [Ruminiclostridium sp.]